MTTIPGCVPGTVLLGKYRVDRVLGSGGMGVVAQATHLQLQERVALKFLLPEVMGNEEVVQRFLREAQAAVKLKGEHVARVTDVGTLEDGVPYMVMEYLDGADLAMHLGNTGAFPPGEAVDLILQACEALAEAHALGIVHRDIKPANLFVTRRPDGMPLLKVLDFGISKAATAVDQGLTRTQAVMGTPAYMSPEQMRSSRNVDARSDIWSLGVVLYELVSGHRPFASESFSELVIKVAVEPLPPLPLACAPGLAEVVNRCLEKDPSRRYQNVAELAAALAPHAATAAGRVSADRAARVLGLAAHTTSPTVHAGDPAGAQRQPSSITAAAGQVVPGPARRRWAAPLLGAVAVAAVTTGLIVVLGGGDGAPDEPASEQPTEASPTAIPPPAPSTAAAPVPIAADAGAVAATTDQADASPPDGAVTAEPRPQAEERASGDRGDRDREARSRRPGRQGRSHTRGRAGSRARPDAGAPTDDDIFDRRY